MISVPKKSFTPSPIISPVYGILDNMTNDYDGLNFDINSLWNKLTEKDNVEFLQEVIEKLG